MVDGTANPFVVGTNETLEGAMAAIDSNGHRCVIVVDNDRRVVGTVSDGDIRRAILARRVPQTTVGKIMTRNCVMLSSGEVDRATQFFDQEHISLIPVVDQEGRLLDVLKAF